MRFSPACSAFIVMSSIALGGCTRTIGDTPSINVIPVAPAVDAGLAVPCQEAAGDKYFMDPDRVVAISSSLVGGNTQVVMKADVRDALCTLNSKGKVVSLVDITPKSADQIAAEEAKALEALNPEAKVSAEKKPVAKKPVVKKKAS